MNVTFQKNELQSVQQRYEALIIILTPQCQEAGQNFAARNIRDLNDPVQEIYNTLEIQKHQIDEQIKCAEQIIDVQRNRVVVGNIKARLKKEYDLAQLSLSMLKKPQITFIERIDKRKKLFFGLAAVIWGVDSIVSLTLFESLAESLPISILFSLGYPIVMLVVAGSMTWVSRSKWNQGLKNKILVYLAILMITLFALLGWLQHTYITENTDLNFPLAGLLVFVMLKVLFVAAICIHFLRPDEQEEDQYYKEKEAMMEHQKLSNTIAETMKASDALDDEQYAREQAATSSLYLQYLSYRGFISAAKALISTIRSSFRKAAPHLEPEGGEEILELEPMTFQQFIHTQLLKTAHIILFVIASHFSFGQGLDLSVIYDRSDERLVVPEIQSYQEIIFTDDLLFQDVSVTINVASNLFYDETFRFHLPKASRITTAKAVRKRKIREFTENIGDAFKEVMILPEVTTRSNVITLVWEELQRQSTNGNSHTLLVVYSDMLENGIVSLYDTKTLRQFQNNPWEVLKRLGLSNSFKGHEGMQMHVLYRPRNEAENQRFAAVMKGWKRLLEDTGIQLTICSRLQYQK